MRLRRRSLLPLAFLFATVAAPPATLQAQETKPARVSLDLALGSEGFRGNPYASAGMAGGEVTVAGRFLRRARASLIAAAVGMQYYEGGNDLECRSEGPEFGCITPTRVLPNLGFLLGAEVVRANTALRITGGPLLYNIENSDPSKGRQSRSATATYARVDLSYPAASPVAFTLSGSTRHLGVIRGERLTLVGVSAGVRLQPRR